jgi:hypothetical protein
MTGRRIEITVDELVLDGLAPPARGTVAEALRRRLGELVAERGLPSGPTEAAAGGTAAADLHVPASSRAEVLGAELAEALYRRLGG